MANRTDVAPGRAIVARWCTLAERRLEHLTELFETGRWRRYYSEPALLENIQEAKAAVETWRRLLTREASLDNSAIDVAWLGRPRSLLPPPVYSRERVPRLRPQPAEPPAKSPPHVVAVAGEIERVAAEEVPAVPDVPEIALAEPVAARRPDLDMMRQRYPLLRNAL
jgi:uncharacterized repeat protein (TIGR03809 family)